MLRNFLCKKIGSLAGASEAEAIYDSSIANSKIMSRAYKLKI